MAAAQPGREISVAYTEALTAWLARGHDSALLRARELGHVALRQGIGTSGMRTVHHESVKEILIIMQDREDRGRRPAPAPGERASLLPRSLTAPDVVAAAGVFFAQSMSAFEVKEREIRWSNVALRYQNHKSERDIDRVTKIVYDEGMQLLAAARLAMAEAALDAKPAVSDSLDQAHKLLDRVEDHLMEFSDSVRPRVLEDLGPRAAVQSLCRRLLRSTRWEVKTELEGFPVRADIGRALYNAVLEALTNIERHARAKRVRILLYEENSVIHCFVQDDGVGFDVPAVLAAMEHSGSGLGLVAETLRSTGGTMTLNSASGSGAEMRIAIDLHKA
jgi:two-component system, NarL family, sensor kinase